MFVHCNLHHTVKLHHGMCRLRHSVKWNTVLVHCNHCFTLNSTYVCNKYYSLLVNCTIIIPAAEGGTRFGYKSLKNKLLIRVDFPSPDSPTEVYNKQLILANC